MLNENQIYILIGDNIKCIREEKAISQQELAFKCGFEKSNMSRIESGRTNLTIKNLWKISNALGVKMKDIVDIDYL